MVEILVVISMIGVLVALLLPAVQAARESARRAACQNRLRQLGLAMVEYEATHRDFPIGCIGCRFNMPEPGQPFVAQRFLSWNIQILPFLDQNTLRSRFDFDRSSYQVPNREAGATILNVFLCPGTQSDKLQNTTGLWKGLAFTDFAGIYGVEGGGRNNTNTNSLHWLKDEYLGVLVYEKPVGAKEVTDGLSNTAFIGEVKLRRVTETEWANGHNLFAQEGSTPLNHASGFGNEIGSPHPQGASVVFCDGHVEFLNDRIRQAILNALLTKAGGEVCK